MSYVLVNFPAPTCFLEQTSCRSPRRTKAKLHHLRFCKCADHESQEYAYGDNSLVERFEVNGWDRSGDFITACVGESSSRQRSMCRLPSHSTYLYERATEFDHLRMFFVSHKLFWSKEGNAPPRSCAAKMLV